MKKPNFFKYVAGFFVGVTLIVIAACGNKSQNNTQPVQTNLYPYQQCVNCQNINGNVFFSGQSSDYTGTLQVTWAFAGQNLVMQQTYPYTASVTPGTYYGPVSTTGQLSLSQNINLGYCQIPAGTYSLVTNQAGQWGYGIVSNLTMQAMGPTNMVVSFFGQVSSPGYLSSGQASSSTNSVGRMFGNLQIQSVNGQTCQQIIGVQ